MSLFSSDLEKKCVGSTLRQWKTRFFVLTATSLVYYTSREAFSKGEAPLRDIPLSSITRIRPDPERSTRFSIDFRPVDGRRDTLVLLAVDDSDLCARWIFALNEQRLWSESASHAPPDEDTSLFLCHICLEEAAWPCVTRCGHLYCWGCLFRWHARSPSCAVCSAGVKLDEVIPLYGRGLEPELSDGIPPRPLGDRPVPEQPSFRQQYNRQFGGFAGDPHVRPFGFGLVGLVRSYILWWQGRQPHQLQLSPEGQQRELLSRMCLSAGIMILLAIIFY